MVFCSMQFGFSLVGVSFFSTSYVSNNGGKYGKRRSTLNIGCRPRKGRVLNSKIIVTHSLDDGVRSISKWTKLPIGPYEVLFLQLQANLVAHLEFFWNPVLIMALLVLGIGLLQNIMDPLSDVLNPFNEPSGFFDLYVIIGRVNLCGFKGKI